MEALRQQFANDPALYPDFLNMRSSSRSASSSATAVSSAASDDAPVKGRKKTNVIEISDTETPIDVPSNQDLALREIVESDDELQVLEDRINGPGVVDRFMGAAETEKALRDLVAGVYTHEDQEYTIEDATVPGFCEGVKLLPHQVTGRRWMADRESGKKAGGILADDMGLGKTIQTITRIVEGRPTKKDKHDGWAATTLVICPVAVVSQWASEIQKMAEGLKVIEHHGQNRTKDPKVLQRAHVVITSYSTVTSEHSAHLGTAKKGKGNSGDSDDSDGLGKTLKAAKRNVAKAQKTALFGVEWWRVVLDEAHNIKNRATKAAHACYDLEAKYRWCLTGTPMQNNVDELYSLLHFLRIKPLNDWPTFSEKIAKPVKSGRPAVALRRLHVVLRSIMLRRTKDTLINGKPIVDLPPRQVGIVDCKFDAREQAFYSSIAEKVRNRLHDMQADGKAQMSYTSVLVLLLRLRQACNHPRLISEDYRNDAEAVDPKASKSQQDVDEADELADQLAGFGLSQKPRCQLCQVELDGPGETCSECASIVGQTRENEKADRIPHSAKTRKIMDILHQIQNDSDGNEKTIIFSQFTSMLDIIEHFLRDEGVKFVRYDGKMNKVQRDESLTKIRENQSIKVILISFKAGSTGLNLTCCNNVILVDLWWNPALEDQAFDRAHRFGQTRTVKIHKLCIPDTVEKRILELQEKKRILAAAALSGDKVKNMRLGIDELVALFSDGGRGGDHNDDDDDDD